MPSRRDGRVEPGQPLRTAFSASAWNRAQDAADVVLGQRPGFEADTSGSYGAPYSRVKVFHPFENPATNAPVWPRWSVVYLQAILKNNQPRINPSSEAQVINTASFESMPIFTAQGSEFSTPSRTIGVLLEPLSPGGICWAAVSGVVQTKIHNGNDPGSVTAQPQVRAKPINQSALQHPARLTTDWFEGYKILWREHARPNEDAWVIIDLSHRECQQLVYLKTTEAVPKGVESLNRSFKPYRINPSDNSLIELNYTVGARNDLIALGANVGVWALHPSASYPMGGALLGTYTVVALADMSQQFRATIGPQGQNSNITLTNVPF